MQENGAGRTPSARAAAAAGDVGQCGRLRPFGGGHTIEEVRTALANVTGIARTALLMGLNFDFYASDIVELAADHVINDGSHVSKVRKKLAHKKNRVKPVWHIWPETPDASTPPVAELKAPGDEREMVKNGSIRPGLAPPGPGVPLCSHTRPG